MVTKARRREILRIARDKMNDNGAHWIKGRLSRKKKIGYCYCTMGAIFATTNNKEETQAVVNDLIEVLGLRKHFFTDFYRGKWKIEGRPEIETWNDSEKRTWKQVDNAFRKAIASLK